MAGGRGRLHKTAPVAASRRSTRSGTRLQQDDDVPVVFQEMLQEEHMSQTTSAHQDARPAKRRRTAPSQPSSSPIQHPSPPQPTSHNGSSLHSAASAALRASSPVPTSLHSRDPTTSAVEPASHHIASSSGRLRQTIEDSDESDDSDEEWEDALADGDDVEDDEGVTTETPTVGDISITIGGQKNVSTENKTKLRRRAITAIDKRKRLDIHKMHVLCLLYHVHRRNVWCNDLRVQTTLRKLVPPKTLLNLVPNPDLTQYSASKRFIDGMNELKILWSKRFKLTAQGMYKPRWTEADADVRPFSDFDDLDDPMDKDDFRSAAHALHGSQDVGTQLFCALLRGIGLETRLVCSLQPLPFLSSAQPGTPQKPNGQKSVIVMDPYNKQEPASPSKSRTSTPSRPKKLSRLERVMGERHAVLNKTGVAPQKQKAYHTPFPVYWVEVFNAAHQKWVPIDTHSTFTVNSPEKLEPPLNSSQNSLTYAVGFEEDYTAKDVTRRYAKAYNAKTRKFRVESMPHGVDWWRRTIGFFTRRIPLDRDQVEDAALARREASEGVPKNVQDFKDHPVYVLERHMKHNTVIHPLNPIGKVNVGTGMNPKLEQIYRRKDVHTVRSADKWYRMGRDVIEGEQPLKHAKPKKGRRLSIGPDVDFDEQQDEVGAALYAEFQTRIYVPPPVVQGRVPRNAYGNLDLYVPSMCPPGGTHIRHKIASKAARIVGVDYADAVTGFSFKGRHGTAIVQGIVVATEYADAVQATIDGMEYQQEEAANAARMRDCLRLWRRFFLGLRIAQRVNAMEIDGEKGPTIDVQGAIDKEDKDMTEKEMAGGFFPDEGEIVQPTGRAHAAPPDGYNGDDGGGFIQNDGDDNMGGGFMPDEHNGIVGLTLNREHSFESSILDSQQFRPRRSSFSNDYILEEDDDEESGGFVRDESPEAGPSTRKDATNNAGGFIPDETETTAPDNMEVMSTTSLLLPELLNDTPMTSPSASSPSDTGSLPLEDPEDEDADPDWLVDAT